MSKKVFLTELSKMCPVLMSQSIYEEDIIVLTPQTLIFTLYFLKNHFGTQYKILSCISGVDLLDKKYRFIVVYDLLSLAFSHRIRIKVAVNEITPIPSATSVFLNANWWEREVWDLFGVFFEGHEDLRRILTDYGFEGFPMRKDFPLYGFLEVRYDEEEKRVVTEPVSFAQEMRSFDYETSI